MQLQSKENTNNWQIQDTEKTCLSSSLAMHRSKQKFNQNILQLFPQIYGDHLPKTGIEIYHLVLQNMYESFREASGGWENSQSSRDDSWHFMLQWITEFTVFAIVGAPIFAVLFILFSVSGPNSGLLVIVDKKWKNRLLHWQVVFMGTLHHRLNVCCALQAVGPPKKPYILLRNVTARSKLLQSLSDLEWSTGLQSWVQSERFRYTKLDSVHGHWDYVSSFWRAVWPYWPCTNEFYLQVKFIKIIKLRVWINLSVQPQPPSPTHTQTIWWFASSIVVTWNWFL